MVDFQKQVVWGTWLCYGGCWLACLEYQEPTWTYEYQAMSRVIFFTHAQILQLHPHKSAHVFVHSVVVFKKWQDFKAGFSSHESIFWQCFVILPCDPSVVTKRILFSNKTECNFSLKKTAFLKQNCLLWSGGHTFFQRQQQNLLVFNTGLWYQGVRKIRLHIL